MRIQVCTPTYIEAENIEEFLRRARAALPEADILVLDDNSPDGTADIAERVAAELGQIEVLRRPEKRGLGKARPRRAQGLHTHPHAAVRTRRGTWRTLASAACSPP